MRFTKLFAAAPLLMALLFGLMAPGPIRAEPAIPEIEEDTTYPEARLALAEQGWSPVPQTPTFCEGGQCGFVRCIGGFDRRCKLWPEALICRGTGLASCEFLWRKNGTDIIVRTEGERDPPGVADITHFSESRATGYRSQEHRKPL